MTPPPWVFYSERTPLAGLENPRTPTPPLHNGTATHERATWASLRPVLWHGAGEGDFLKMRHHGPPPKDSNPGGLTGNTQ
jgi:hypothetical protein